MLNRKQDKGPNNKKSNYPMFIGGAILIGIIISAIVFFPRKSTKADTAVTDTEITDIPKRRTYLQDNFESLAKILFVIIDDINNDKSTATKVKEIKDLVIKQKKELYLNILEEMKSARKILSAKLTEAKDLSFEVKTFSKTNITAGLKKSTGDIGIDLSFIIEIMESVENKLSNLSTFADNGIDALTDEVVNAFIDGLIEGVKQLKIKYCLFFSIFVDVYIEPYRKIIAETIREVLYFEDSSVFKNANVLMKDTLTSIKEKNPDESKILTLKETWKKLRESCEEVQNNVLKMRGFA